MTRKLPVAQTTLSVLVIGLLICASLWVLQPFLGAVIWATMVVVTTWPLMLRVQRLCRGRRWAAVLAMTLALLLLFAVPFTVVLLTIVDHADQIVGWGRSLSTMQVPEAPPVWLTGLPLVGERISVFWKEAVAAGLSGLIAKLQPYAGDATRWFAGQVGSVGFVVLQFFLTVVIAGVMYGDGERAAAKVRRFAFRLGGAGAEAAVLLAGDAIRGVALGVGVTAIVQSVLGGIGLAIVGVPFASLLTALMFMFCLAQLGPTLVLVPATIWVFYTQGTGWGIFLLVWTVVVGTLDNFLRPALIRMGADLPLLLIFAGVIGGLIGFGLVGIFVGPVLLAVAYTLLDSWISEGDEAEPPQPVNPA